jgi:multidrug efflux pump subunit AcrA (membrane-fusion protein)
MKIRHVLIIISSFCVITIIALSFSVGRQVGIQHGVENAEKIRAEKKRGNQLTTDSITPKYVKALTVKNEIHPIQLTGYGKVISATSINISTEVQGILSSNITIKKGTHFRKGQVLFTIKNNDVRLGLQSKKSSFLTQLTTILPDLNIDYPESFNQWKLFFEKIDVHKPLPPLPSFKSTKEKSFIISRNILSQYYGIQSDEERLKKYTITAPFSGSIIETYTDVGANVAPGMTVIKILREGKLEIEIPILSNNLSLIKKGQEVQLKDNNGHISFGEISRIGNYINPTTQTIPAFVDIISGEDNLYNGMYLESTINCNSLLTAAKIPRTAIFDDEKVFLITNDNQLKEIKIKISTYQDKTVLVTGLEDGLKIVSEAIVNAKDGTTVAILN